MSDWKAFNELDIENPEDKLVLLELCRFNWGAFGLTWLWGLFNGVFEKTIIAFVLFILAFAVVLMHYPSVFLEIIVLFLLVFAIYCGQKGNIWVYEKKQVEDFSKFIEVQKKWAVVTAGLFVCICILFIAVCSYVWARFSMVFTPRGRGRLVMRPLANVVIKYDKVKPLKNGKDVAKLLLQMSESWPKKLVPYGSSGVMYEHVVAKDNKNVFALTFYKEDTCSVKKRNCYIYYYEALQGDTLKAKAKVYYDDNGDIKFVEINDKD